MARARVPWVLLALLAGAGGLYWLWSRNRARGGAGDVLEELVVTAKRIGSTVSAAIGGWLEKVPAQLRPQFAAAAALYGLPSNLLEAVAWRESRFDPAVMYGGAPNSKGAIGVMQIIPRWHPAVGAAGAADPARAIPYAAKYLRELYQQFGDWKLALAAYNWGPGNQQKDLLDKIIGNEWPAETRAYVAEIARNAGLA